MGSTSKQEWIKEAKHKFMDIRSKDRGQTLLGDDYGVRWIENYHCYDDPKTPFPGGAATARRCR